MNQEDLKRVTDARMQNLSIFKTEPKSQAQIQIDRQIQSVKAHIKAHVEAKNKK